MSIRKRVWIGLLSLILFLLATGCSDKITDTTKSLDLDNQTFYDFSHPVTETENGYFVMLNGFLHFMDKETDNFVVFSNDSITPKELQEQCFLELAKEGGEFSHEAYFPGSSNVFYHNEKLYTMISVNPVKNEWDLIEINPGTHERKVLAKFTTGEGDFVLLENKIFCLDYLIYFSDNEKVLQKIESDKEKKTSGDSVNDSEISKVNPTSQEAANQQALETLIKYKITGYDLETNKVIEPIDVAIPDQVSMYKQSIPVISGYKDKMQIRIDYHVPYDADGKAINVESKVNIGVESQEGADSKFKANSEQSEQHKSSYSKLVTFEFDINDHQLQETALEYSPKLEFENAIVKSAYLAGNIYRTKMNYEFDANTRQFTYLRTWTDVKNIDSNQEDLFQEIEHQWLIESNGHNLYLMPGSIAKYDLEKNVFFYEDFSIKKWIENKWQDLITIKKSELEKMRPRMGMAIGSNDDIIFFDSTGGSLYKVQEDKIIKIIDYYELRKKP